MNNCISVSGLNTYIKSLIDSNVNLKNVFVIGEISNLNIHYKSGHIYLSLKDEKSVVKAVMFSFSAKKLKFTPCDGMKIIARGRVSVYEAGGQYQLYIEDMQPDGLGALNLAYEQLWEKLKHEGLFEDDKKKYLPRYPEKIGVITSPTGAAVQDIISILDRRWPVAEVKLFPCTVQGENAVTELTNALKKADGMNLDCIIIGRGGGSLEDLWAFNDEGLARLIYSCKTPIISAVGHENDFTICDYVADKRASTPSAAAEIAVPMHEEEYQRAEILWSKIRINTQFKIQNYAITLDKSSNVNKALKEFMERKKEKFEVLIKNVQYNSQNIVQKAENRAMTQIAILDSLSPLKVLTRGYSVLTKDGCSVSSVKELKENDEIKARLIDGEINLIVRK